MNLYQVTAKSRDTEKELNLYVLAESIQDAETTALNEIQITVPVSFGLFDYQEIYFVTNIILLASTDSNKTPVALLEQKTSPKTP